MHIQTYDGSHQKLYCLLLPSLVHRCRRKRSHRGGISLFFPIKHENPYACLINTPPITTHWCKPKNAHTSCKHVYGCSWGDFLLLLSWLLWSWNDKACMMQSPESSTGDFFSDRWTWRRIWSKLRAHHVSWWLLVWRWCRILGLGENLGDGEFKVEVRWCM